MTTTVTEIGGVPLRGRFEARWGILTAKPWAHAPGCACAAHQTFTCDRCGRRVGHCLGSYDNMPGACDFCWTPEGQP